MKQFLKQIRRRIFLRILMLTSRYMQDKTIYLQSQMDINKSSFDLELDFVNDNGGFFINGDSQLRTISDLDPWDNCRRDMLILLLRNIIFHNIEGSLAELGVYKGLTAKLIHHYVPERELYLFDTFEGFSSQDIQSELLTTSLKVNNKDFMDTSLSSVRNFIKPKNDNVNFIAGTFPDSLRQIKKIPSFSFVHIDADLYQPTIKALDFFYPLLNPGGFIVVHDYNAWPGARKAVDEYATKLPVIPIPTPDKSGSVIIAKPKNNFPLNEN